MVKCNARTYSGEIVEAGHPAADCSTFNRAVFRVLGVLCGKINVFGGP
jgi:hypothetical protein